MINYELATRLKNAGFPQGDEILDVYYPNLKEIILACGKYFYKLEKENKTWLAFGRTPIDETCSTCHRAQTIFKESGENPEIAISLLWLKLKKG